MGPDGGGGGRHGGQRWAPKLPNQLITSPETVKYIEEVHERTEKKDEKRKR